MTNSIYNYKKGIILCLLGGICWGFSGSCGQYVFSSSNISPQWVTVVRMLVAGSTLFLFTFKRNIHHVNKLIKNKSQLFELFIFALLGIFICQLTYLTAIKYTNAGTATTIQYTGPVMVLVYVSLKSLKIPSKWEILAIFLAFIGTFILATHGDLNSLVISPKGLFWGVLSAIGLATYTLTPVNLLKNYSSSLIMSSGMLVSGIVAFFLLRFWTISVDLNIHNILGVAGIVIFGTLLSFYMYMEGLKIIGPVKASIIATIEPLAATIFSIIWLGTAFTFMDFLGFIFIISTIFILSLQKT